MRMLAHELNQSFSNRKLPGYFPVQESKITIYRNDEMAFPKDPETAVDVIYDRQLFYTDVDIGGLADGLKLSLIGNSLF